MRGRRSGFGRYQRALVALYGRLLDASQRMTPEQRAELEAWEREHVDGSGRWSSSDWPGWERLVTRRSCQR